MSLSINHSPLFNGDTTSMERLSPSMSKTFTQTGTLGANTTVAHPGVPRDPFKVSNSNMTIETGGLARLLDMLEQVVKTVREMFSGRNMVSGMLPGADRTPAIPVDASKLPEKPGHLALTADRRGQPALPVSPHMHQSAASVIKDADNQVQVNVNVGHCHCPDTKALSGETKPNAAAVLPRVMPMPEAARKVEVVPVHTPTHTHTPAPTPMPTHTPTPTPTPMPMPTHTHTHTPAPTPTPMPTHTHTPAPTPTPTPTHKHTPTPEVMPAPKPGVHALEVKPRPATPEVPAITPQPQPQPQPQPDTPTPDITSPGPAEPQSDMRDWRTSRRPAFRA